MILIKNYRGRLIVVLGALLGRIGICSEAWLPSLRADLSFLGLLQFTARALWQLQEALKLRKFSGFTPLKPLNNFYKLVFFPPCYHEEENLVGDELLPSAALDPAGVS